MRSEGSTPLLSRNNIIVNPNRSGGRFLGLRNNGRKEKATVIRLGLGMASRFKKGHFRLSPLLLCPFLCGPLFPSVVKGLSPAAHKRPAQSSNALHFLDLPCVAHPLERVVNRRHHVRIFFQVIPSPPGGPAPVSASTAKAAAAGRPTGSPPSAPSPFPHPPRSPGLTG